jgi:HEAT repeat protein
MIWNHLPQSVQSFLPRPLDIPATHLVAAAVLSRFGTNAQAAIPSLVRFFDTPEGNSGLEPWIVRVLCNSQVNDETLNGLIQRFSKHRNYERVLNMIEELHRSNREISESLVLILEHGKPEQQRRAARLLAGTPSLSAATVIPLRSALTNADSEVRYAAIRALARPGMNLESLKPDLEKATRDENSMVATVARRAESVTPK